MLQESASALCLLQIRYTTAGTIRATDSITWSCRRPIPADFQEHAGLHLAGHEVSSPTFPTHAVDISVESLARIALDLQQPHLKAFSLI